MTACLEGSQIKQVLGQAWTLTWQKQFIINWRASSLWSLLSLLALDIGVPVALVYLYLINLLDNPHRPKPTATIDPTVLRASMDSAMSNMLLPIAFFSYCRKSISQIVLEKEKGMQEYLVMNGMS